uniref:Metalloendopeptidase n=1 Tax=Parastrongyloides trichosuri TaxID=131310 RepID=A0A0N4ZZP3_PARTI
MKAFLNILFLSIFLCIDGAIRKDPKYKWSNPNKIKVFIDKDANYFRFEKVKNKLIKEKGINVLKSNHKCYSDHIGAKPFKEANEIFIHEKCKDSGIIVQSLILQVLGLENEHNRIDRDKFVRIITDNINKNDLLTYFKKDSKKTAETYGTNYDYGSALHGYFESFTSNNGKTIQVKGDHALYYSKMIGQREVIGFNEYKLVNKHYCDKKCVSSSKNKKKDSSIPKCHNDGYPNPNKCVECLCPFPYTSRDCSSFHISNGQGCPEKKSSFHISNGQGCPEKKLIAFDAQKLISFSKIGNCYTMIEAKDSKKTIHIRVSYISFNHIKFCSREKDNFLEVQYKKDKTLMGLCFCVGTLIDGEHNIYSEGNKVMLIYRGVNYYNKVDIYYNQHIVYNLQK